MKIITWNCAGKFREDYQKALELQPDILVIQESENISKLPLLEWEKYPSSYIEKGDGKKNIAVFTFGKYKAKLLDCYNETFKYVIPFEISDDTIRFTLFAIWTKQNKERSYLEQILEAVQFYKSKYPSLLEKCIFAGDFNSSNVFNKKYPRVNHSLLLEEFDALKISSCYHKFFNEEQGEETNPTFYLQRNLEKAFHIDYCFATEDFISNLKSVDLGKANDYIKYSDHLPLSVEFDF